jgi:hypothetical protein
MSEESEPNETASSMPQGQITTGPGPETPNDPFAPSGLPEKPPTDAGQTRKDFNKGLNASLLINGMLLMVYFCTLGFQELEFGSRIDTRPFVNFGVAWMLGNLFIMIILAIDRREILKGMVAGYALIFFMTLIAGVVLSAYCLNPVR